MRPFASLYAPFGRGLARQVEHLRGTLDRLCGRLRDSIVQAVAEATARAVREALTVIAGQPIGRLPADADARRHPSLMWHDDPYRDDWHDDRDGPRFDEEEPRSLSSSPSSTRLASALALGLRVAAWALRRAGRLRIPIAVGTGLLVAAATYAGGPLIAAGAGCVGSLACLLSLDRVVPAEPEPFAESARW